MGRCTARAKLGPEKPQALTDWHPSGAAGPKVQAAGRESTSLCGLAVAAQEQLGVGVLELQPPTTQCSKNSFCKPHCGKHIAANEHN
eukprot:8575113-Alexandrium_andersonii.AAC.1